jgi:DNA-directed RNA polymerase alpha subunit
VPPSRLHELESALKNTDIQERDILQRRHGFGGVKESLKNIAQIKGLSVSRISQIEHEVLRRLRRQLARAERGPLTKESVSLEDLELSSRARRILSAAGLQNLFDVCNKSPSFFRGLPGFGTLCLENLQTELARYELHLAPEGQERRNP